MVEISQNISKAAEQLRAGGIVAFATETVYGLGGLAADGKAVARIYDAKGRPEFNPLITHLYSASDAFEHGIATSIAEKLAEAFWPGPMTLILKKRDDSSVSDLACAGLDTIALRVPKHQMARALIQEVGAGIVAPSANKSGRISPTRTAHVASQFDKEIDLILEGGDCQHGLESTIIDVTSHTAIIRRPGPISRTEIEAVIGPLPDAPPTVNDSAPNAPGQLTSHYAPQGTVRLNRTCKQNGAFYIGFGRASDAISDINLSRSGDLIEAAATLFSALHAADAADAKFIDVAPIPNSGLGEAICDRLQRAAAP